LLARSATLIFLFLAVGCGPAIGVVRMGTPHAALPADCKLQFLAVSASDLAPGGKLGPDGEYEMVGSVMIGADDRTDAMSEQIRRIVRPRACRMGGAVVSLLASGSGSNDYAVPQQNIAFTVWGQRPRQSTAPQTF
jgi:hypothetical protein